MKILPSILTIFLSTIIAQPELNIPDNISFQGFLTQSDGVAYADGEYEITFKLIIPTDNGYETTIWQEMHSIEVYNGVFNTYLGNINNLPYNALSSDVMLEIQVGNTILSPRQSFSSVPFAFKSQNSIVSMTSNHATTADTANYIVNMPDVDSVQFSQTSQVADYAETADYVVNPPPPISVYDEFWSINNSNTFNTTSAVVVVDTTFEQHSLKFYLQGLINYNGNQSGARTEIFFAPVNELEENPDGSVYLLDENPQYREEPRKLKLIGQYHNASQDSDDMNTPQLSFFFYIKPELQNTRHRLVIQKASGTSSNDMVMWGKFWGQ